MSWLSERVLMTLMGLMLVVTGWSFYEETTGLTQTVGMTLGIGIGSLIVFIAMLEILRRWRGQ